MRLASDYAVSRARFLDAAKALDARLDAYVHPLSGPAGDRLATDVAYLGNPNAPTRLLVISGTHGVEGFAGSACQTRWLTEGVTASDDLAVVIVHALNPYGFAWVRRVNEDNVDLNRNFIDFESSLPANLGYDELAGALVPDRWDDETQEATAKVLLGYATEHGFPDLQAAVSKGQYTHPTGIFYGGSEAVWSRKTIRSISSSYLAGVERLGVIDLHTGLGERGIGEAIAEEPDASERTRLEDWYEEFTVPTDGTSVSAVVTGDILAALKRWLPNAETTAIALEFGTVDMVAVSNALRGDAWLHAHADPLGPEALPIKAALSDAFAPGDEDWARIVWGRFVEIIEQTTSGLLA